MPAGVSTTTYVKFASSALLSMAAGSQFVHLYYRPLKDIEEFVKESEDRIIPEHIKEILNKEKKPKQS